MINTSTINKIILDFGGVIYNIDHQKQKETFSKFGLDNFEELYSQARQSPLFSDFECGKISSNAFRSEVNDMLGNRFSESKIDIAWNSILIGFPTENVKLLEQLSKHYTIYLLSNTNAIHYNVYINEFRDKFGYDFNALFEKSFWSFKVGMRKPNHNIYKHVVSECGINDVNTLFIDDTQVNVTTAKEARINSYWLKPGKKLKDLFDSQYVLRL